MDFNPDHEKWQCCCCNLLSGLKILSAAEVIVFSIVSVIFVVTTANNWTDQERDWVFQFVSLGLCVSTVICSLCLFVGLRWRQVKLMYPSVVCRVAVIIMLAVFGVSQMLQPEEEEFTDRAGRNRKRISHKHDEPSTTARLIFLILIMMAVSSAAFYTIYLIMNAANYITNYNKLRDRRQSLIQASQIDPELMEQAYRRSSHNSYS